MEIIVLIFCLLLGLVAGISSGAFGIGGGTITTPALRDILRVNGHIALGTPLPMVIPTAVSGALVYHRRGLIKYRVGAICALTGSISSMAAAYMTVYFSGKVLMLITSLYIAVVAIKFALKGKKMRRTNVSHGAFLFRAMLVGAVAGTLSGFLGVGGGVILVPAMMLLLDLPIHEAIGTSLMVMAIYVIPGSTIHFFLGHVDVVLLIPVVSGSILGSQVGARIAVRTRERMLKLSFSVFLFVIAVFMAIFELM
ncbi:MAG: hypothetical protein DRN83_00385 [Hadesarchaea archaeon]|nr:MAG: hypothetical protein DRN83_00385 [Hadesarchaea archaeon]HDI13088.1 sulfite exporter TauE/SafE family protein [Hadesarchaea archaeon]